MRLLPRSRRARVAVATGLAAAVLALGWCREYRPWEAHYRGKPTSWWAAWVGDPEWRKPRPPWESLWVELRALLGGPYLVDIPDLEMPPKGPEAIPVLIELLDWPNDKAREWAADKLLLWY